ncbi:TetR/AcrR family transcriptional regulator [Arthrobacter bambusae]|uniref:TetR/AcrR family transcriptional regulator n=1 Tax=Arthrobacter bambusae TaxID=1338426 RepID=UPI002782FB99|nr:TetR family transcriptional regulator [Arthrobacter bambusae]MDQ0029839.1 DNA-binding transcriptional regulator YbjK [Arthrobacter bambusae]MDQ0097643.1 DNA-binding transcriptional regulator YbjK [Arthrobacter bambusae]
MASRRFDPERRDRIIDAALDVIATQGVAGASHRKIAEHAGVPLGSMTYHFVSMDELLTEAFRRFANSIADRFDQQFGEAADVDGARQAVVDLIHLDLLDSQRDLVLTHELYTLAARKPVFRRITRDWMARSRRALGLHFDPETCRMLDALIEGLFIHAALDIEPHDRAIAVEAVARITTPSEAHLARETKEPNPT